MSELLGTRHAHTRRLPLGVAVAVALAVTLAAFRPAPAHADITPADLLLDQTSAAMVQMCQFAGPAGWIMAPRIEMMNLFQQSLLRAISLQEEDAVLTAWTTQQLADIRQQLEQATAASRYLVAKLNADVAWYEEQNGAFASPTFAPRSTPERRLYENYKQVKAFVDAQGPLIAKAGDDVLAAFSAVRQRVQRGAYGSPSLKNDSQTMLDALAAYGSTMDKAMADFDRDIFQARVSPEQNLRLTFTNDSSDLVFFVRVWERDADGNYPSVRPDTESWVIVYPRGLAVELDGSGGKRVSATMPNEVWAPAKLRAKVEVRVATMGDTRKRIRFQPLNITGQVRPDIESYRRGFYFYGYYVDTPNEGRKISHFYPAAETYDWVFGGGWAPGNSASDPEFYMPTEAARDEKMKQLRVDPRKAGRLTLTRDHVVWYLPASFDSVKDEPFCTAQVAGSAEFERQGPKPGAVTKLPPESGSGDLSMEMRIW